MSKVIVIKGQAHCARAPFKANGTLTKINIQTIEGVKERVFSLEDVDEFDPVSNRYKPLGKHWMDVVTGSLYEKKTGNCLSSDQIKLVLE